MSQIQAQKTIYNWQKKLQIEQYTIGCEYIYPYQVCDDSGKRGHSFVGICADHIKCTACLYHTRELHLDDIIHELLHVKHPDWTEQQVNTETNRLLRGGDVMQFYNVKTRESVEIPDNEVTVITMKNGKKAAKATHNGTNLFKILSKEDAIRLAK